jgi:hypothetical protein
MVAASMIALMIPSTLENTVPLAMINEERTTLMRSLFFYAYE